MNTFKVALLELGGSHAECLHSQIRYLSDSGCEVYLICDTVTWEQIEEKHLLKNVQIHRKNSSILAQIKLTGRVHRFLRKHSIEKLIVNTVEITPVRNIFFFPLPQKMECIGIVHNGLKLTYKSTVTKVTGRKMKKFFVLNSYIKQHLTPIIKDYQIGVFYPIFFPKFGNVNIVKPDGEIRIVIPGEVNPKRRDYTGLLSGITREGLHERVKILLLGKMDAGEYPELATMLERTDISGNRPIWFDDFVDNRTFHAYLQQCDLVLPLIDAADEQSIYGVSRISGSFNLAFAYKIPFLIEESWMTYEDFSDCSISYHKPSLISVINSLPERLDEIAAKKESMLRNPKWTDEYQQRTYLSFIRQ